MIYLLTALLAFQADDPATGPFDAIESRIVEAVSRRQAEQMEALGDRIKALSDALASARQERAEAREERKRLLESLAEARRQREGLASFLRDGLLEAREDRMGLLVRIGGVRDSLRTMITENRKTREAWTPLLTLVKRLIALGTNLIWLLVLVAVLFEGTRLLLFWMGKRTKEFFLPTVEDI